MRACALQPLLLAVVAALPGCQWPWSSRPVAFAPIIRHEGPAEPLGWPRAEWEKRRYRVVLHASIVAARPEVFRDLGGEPQYGATVVPRSDAFHRAMRRLRARRDGVFWTRGLSFAEAGWQEVADVDYWNYVGAIDFVAKGSWEDDGPIIGDIPVGVRIRVRTTTRDWVGRPDEVVFTEVEALATRFVAMHVFRFEYTPPGAWIEVDGVWVPDTAPYAAQEPVVLRLSRRLDVPDGLQVPTSHALVVPLRHELVVARSPLRDRVPAGAQSIQDGTAAFLAACDKRGYPLRELHFLILTAGPLEPTERPECVWGQLQPHLD